MTPLDGFPTSGLEEDARARGLIGSALAETLGQVWNDAVDDLDPGADQTEIILHLERLTGVSLADDFAEPIADQLKQEGKRILIIIDDLDRCEPDFLAPLLLFMRMLRKDHSSQSAA